MIGMTSAEGVTAKLSFEIETARDALTPKALALIVSAPPTVPRKVNEA